MPILETLALIGAISSGASGLASTISGLVGGTKATKEAEKAQAYQEKWTERLYADQMRQQTLQNKLNQEKMDLALRTEARQNTADWHTYMQNAANKYADILNRTRDLRKSNAAALQNR